MKHFIYDTIVINLVSVGLPVMNEMLVGGGRVTTATTFLSGTEISPVHKRIFRGRPNISVGQPILVQPKYNRT